MVVFLQTWEGEAAGVFVLGLLNLMHPQDDFLAECSPSLITFTRTSLFFSKIRLCLNQTEHSNHGLISVDYGDGVYFLEEWNSDMNLLHPALVKPLDLLKPQLPHLSHGTVMMILPTPCPVWDLARSRCQNSLECPLPLS
jgi:hypothetical protein